MIDQDWLPYPEGESNDRFLGVERMVGPQGLARLQASHVTVVGIGGVGSWAAEAVARSGVGRVSLIDPDAICVNNMNRQLHTLTTTVGRDKVQAMTERLQAINPNCRVDGHVTFLAADNTEALLQDTDIVVDAIDSVDAKCFLLDYCRRRSLPVVTTGGAGGITDVRRIRVADIAQCYNDPLLARVRKILRCRYDFPRNPHTQFGIPCVFSFEKARILPRSNCTTLADAMFGQSTKKTLDCSSGYGTFGFVTGSFGLMAAGVAIEQLLAMQTASVRYD